MVHLRPAFRLQAGLVAALLSGSAALFAQSPQAPLTLDAAIARAMAANPAVMAARLAAPVAIAGRGLASERPNPELAYEAERELPHQSITLTVPLELGGKRDRRLALADASIKASDADIARVISDLRADVRHAYFQLVSARLRVDLAGDVRALAVRGRDAAQTRFTAGDVPRQDVVQLELALRQADNEVSAAQGEAAAVAAELNALLGQPTGTAIVLGEALSAGAVPTLDAALSLAQANTELAALDRRIDEQIAKRDLAKAMQTPDMGVGGAIAYNAQPEFVMGWRASFAVTLPLFTRHQAAVKIEDAELTRLRADREARAKAIAAAVTAARERAVAARDRLTRYQNEMLPLVVDVERMAQDAYNAGQTGLPAFLTALQQTRDIRRQGLEAGLEFQQALTDLERAIGAPVR